MESDRKLRLHRERLAELAIDDLRLVVAGADHTIDTNCCTCQTSLNSECGATTCVYSVPCATAILPTVQHN